MKSRKFTDGHRMSMPPPKDASCFLFLYGSLRLGSGNPHVPILHSRCMTAGQGTMPGRLFRVNQHYGAVYDPASSETVIGDIVQFPCELAPEILETLDRYEGIGPGLPQPAAFRREEVQVIRADGSTVTCWTWLYALSTSGCSHIRHGDAQSRA